MGAKVGVGKVGVEIIIKGAILGVNVRSWSNRRSDSLALEKVKKNEEGASVAVCDRKL